MANTKEVFGGNVCNTHYEIHIISVIFVAVCALPQAKH